MANFVNPIVGRLGGTLVLIVPGRRTGLLRTVPLGRPFDDGGIRYLVAGGGETQWARNLRAAGGGQLRYQGVTLPFRALEIEGPERARIVAAYRAQQGSSVERFFGRLPVASDHPVFRVVPLE